MINTFDPMTAASAAYRSDQLRLLSGRVAASEARALSTSDYANETLHDMLSSTVEKTSPILGRIERVVRPGTSGYMTTVNGSDALSYVAEGDAIPADQDGTWDEAEFTHFKFGWIIQASEELAADAPHLERWLAEESGRRIAATIERSMVRGGGTTEPTGLIATLGTAAVTTSTATAVTFAELSSLYAALDGAYIARASWLMSPATWAAIVALNVHGAIAPSFVDGAVADLLGVPVFVSSQMDDLGSGNSPIFLGDFSRVVEMAPAPPEFRRLNERFIDDGQVAFRLFGRHDIKLIDAAAIARMECSA